MSLLINAAAVEQDMLVTVEGEVDVSNAPELREALDEALTHAAGLANQHVRIDISQVPYIDSTGIGVLVGTVHRGEEQGVTVSVERPQRNVARVLGLLGLDVELGVRDAAE
ncbi:MAG: STAS domain-containing protein [Atopobiaceae bacterium]|nr:STAS domain-containing protein [Atopobiaceae bacterium]